VLAKNCAMTLDAFRQRRSALKREAILAAAASSFRREGYMRTSMEGLARAAGVSTATLYRQFSSKEDLFDAVASRTMDQLALDVGEGAAADAGLGRLARAYARLLSEPETRGMFRMVVSECGRDAVLAERFYRAVKARLSDLFVGALEMGVAKGLLKPIPGPEQAAGQLQGMIEHGTLMRGLVLGDEIETLSEADVIADEALATWFARWGN